MTKITYDQESEILSIKLKDQESTDSDIQENCVIDYDSKGNIVNIDILNINISDIINSKQKGSKIDLS